LIVSLRISVAKMGSACSSSSTKSDKDIRHPQSRRPSSQAKRESAGVAAALRVGADGEANVNALQADGDARHVDDDDEIGGRYDGDDENDDDVEEATADRVIRLMKLSALSLMTAAGAYVVSRKAISGVAADLTARLEAESGGTMSGVEAQMLPAKFSPGCVSCGLKSLKTVVEGGSVQQNASRGAIIGNKNLHKAYAAGDDFTPPRVYHNYWAAGGFPSQYYSKSETIKNYRFTRIFGW